MGTAQELSTQILWSRRLLPLNPIEQCAQSFAFLGVNHFNEGNSPLQMGTKLRMRVAILAVRSMPDAIGERGLQLIEVRAQNVQPLVCNQPC